MYRKSTDRKSDYIKVLVEPSYKEEIQDLADTLDISVGTLMRMAFNTFKVRFEGDSLAEPTEELLNAYKESLDASKRKKTKIASGKDFTKILDD